MLICYKICGGEKLILRKETVFLSMLSCIVFFNIYNMHDEFPDILNTSIVNTAFDTFWHSEKAMGLAVKDTLVISLLFAQGSAEEIQLLKMLGACRLTPEHYQIVQLLPGELVAWHQLRERSKATKVLLLGVLPAQLGISAMMIPHEVNHFDSVQWMPTFSLDQIATNDALKKHLWVNVFQEVYFKQNT